MSRKPSSSNHDCHKGQSENWRLLTVICLALMASVVAAYHPILRNDFINFDDPDYVVNNTWVKSGLTWEGVKQAFDVGYASNWHPLTWFSHMLDCQLFGLNAGRHHLTSGIWHVLNTLLLFFLIRQLTSANWRSAIVAALFALHPLHVESVAWLSERKDLLSTFFGLLTLMAYARYASESKVQSPKAKVWYGVALLCFALGLMSKPMLVTWPLVMLVLDFWPLGRATKAEGRWKMEGGRSLGRLVWEKIPFFILAAGSSLMTFIAQRSGGAVAQLTSLPLEARIYNAVTSYAGYLQKMLWPADLAAYYPFSQNINPLAAGGAGLLLAAISLIVFRMRTRRPYLVCGWLWYLITLLPVIGLVQVGSQAMADRYTYIPLIGPFISLVWAGAEIARAGRKQTLGLASLTLALLITCAGLTWNQCQYWKDSVTLHRHTLAVTKTNPLTHLNLGSALIARNEPAEAAEQYKRATELRPDYAEAWSNLGFALTSQGKPEAAIAAYETALRLKPNGKTHFLLGNALAMLGKIREGLAHYSQSLELEPDNPIALNDLSWILATNPEASLRNGTEAVRYGERACELTQRQEPMFLGTLAAAYAESGRFPEAIRTAQEAIQLAEKNGFKELAARNAELIKLYEAEKPYRDQPSNS